MKKKGSRDIPDFSSRRSAPPREGLPQAKSGTMRSPSRPPVVKPQATSAKSGRRGQ